MSVSWIDLAVVLVACMFVVAMVDRITEFEVRVTSRILGVALVALVLLGTVVLVPAVAAATTLGPPGSPTGSTGYQQEPPDNETPAVLPGRGCWVAPGGITSLGVPSTTCLDAYIKSFDVSRAQDGVSGTLVLPSNWTSLTNPEQQFVLVNLTRTAYGETPFVGITPLLTDAAQQGVNNGTDPPASPYQTEFLQDAYNADHNSTGAPLADYYSTGANPLPNIWAMLYADGCGGPTPLTGRNGVCPGGSWGHRISILAHVTSTQCPQDCTALAGAAGAPSGIAFAAMALGPEPLSFPITFSWAQELPSLPACEQHGDTCTSVPTPPAPSTIPSTTTSTIGDTAAVSIAATPNGAGYWIATANGGVFTFGDAQFYGSMGGVHLNAPISHIVTTANGQGYWLVADDGGVFCFGDAQFYGSMGGKPLNAPVMDIIPTANGGGYWLVATDGGIFSFGNAQFYGSMGGHPLNAPVNGGSFAQGGYRMVANDGGIFDFGGAQFYGSMGGQPLNRPIVGMADTPNGAGYWLVASDGGIFSFGNAQFYGSMGSHPLNAPVVGMAADSATGGYWEVAADGGVFTFNAPFYGSGA